jgi:hypothetical protein
MRHDAARYRLPRATGIKRGINERNRDDELHGGSKWRDLDVAGTVRSTATIVKPESDAFDESGTKTSQ